VGVHERVLGSVVDQPDYGYSIVKRLGDEYTSAAIYKALRNLRELGAVEPIAVVSDDDDRPKKWYRATPRGAREHSERVSLMLQKRLANARPETIAAVVDEIDLHERRVLESLRQNPPEPGDLIGEIAADERLTTCRGRLKWAASTRERINAATSA